MSQQHFMYQQIRSNTHQQTKNSTTPVTYLRSLYFVPPKSTLDCTVSNPFHFLVIHIKIALLYREFQPNNQSIVTLTPYCGESETSSRGFWAIGYPPLHPPTLYQDYSTRDHRWTPFSQNRVAMKKANLSKCIGTGT